MAGPHRGGTGEILSLLDLIEEHEQAFAYDWRTRFGLPLSSLFDGSMAWHEAWNLTRELLSDPTSRVATATAGWSEPMSREAQVLADLFDLTVGIHAGKRRPRSYPRPWDEGPKRYGKTDLPRAQVLAILASRGHGVQPPSRDSRGRIHGPDGRYLKG